jgi:hypothetical protein
MSTAARFRAGIESWDIDAVGELLAPDIVFNTPVMPEPYVGRDKVTRLLSLVAQTFEEFRYTDELHGDGAHALVFKAKVAGNDVQGIDLIRIDQQDLVAEFTVLLRPISGLMPFAETIGPKIMEAGLMPSGA